MSFANRSSWKEAFFSDNININGGTPGLWSNVHMFATTELILTCCQTLAMDMDTV